MHIPPNGQGRIRTHGAVTPSSFQDLHHQPLGHLTLTILVINSVTRGYHPRLVASLAPPFSH